MTFWVKPKSSMEGPCGGLLPAATQFLRELLEAAFPQAEVRVYGKPWP